MQKFTDVNELVNSLKPDYPVYCIRPDSIKNARKAYNETSSINAKDLKDVEDQAIEKLILMQEQKINVYQIFVLFKKHW